MYLLLLMQRYGAWRGETPVLQAECLEGRLDSTPECQTPVHLRRDVQDVHAFAQVFVHREYDFDWPEDVRRIVDGGANVGFASLFFKAQFPEAQIHAVEPSSAQCRSVSQEHIAFGRHFVTKGASPYGSQAPSIDGRRLRDQRIHDPGRGGIRQHGGGRGDPLHRRHSKGHGLGGHCVVKLDIEGGEHALFQTNLEWMESTRFIVLEFHERMVPSSSKPALKALAERGFAVLDVRGENVLFGRSA